MLNYLWKDCILPFCWWPLEIPIVYPCKDSVTSIVAILVAVWECLPLVTLSTSLMTHKMEPLFLYFFELSWNACTALLSWAYSFVRTLSSIEALCHTHELQISTPTKQLAFSSMEWCLLMKRKNWVWKFGHIYQPFQLMMTAFCRRFNTIFSDPKLTKTFFFNITLICICMCMSICLHVSVCTTCVSGTH